MAAKNLSGAGVLYSDRRNFYLQPQVVQELWTDVTPFTTLVSNRNIIGGLADPLFKLFEHREPWVKQQFNITGAFVVPNNDTGIGSVTIGTIVGLASTLDSSYVGLTGEVWDTTLTTKRGQAVISAVNGSTDLTLKLLSTTAFTTVSGDVFIVYGSVSGEGSTAPDAWADELKVVWGSTQMIETAIEITGTLYKASLRGYNKELERLRMSKNREQKMKVERTLLLGSSVIGTGLADSRDGTSNESFADTARTIGGLNSRTTTGLITALERYGLATGDDQNLFTIPEASYKFSNFVDDMEKVFHYYPDGGTKYAFCGPGAMSYWSKLDGNSFMVGKSGWQVRIGDNQRDQLGFSIRMLETPHGMLALVPTPALRGPYNKKMIVVSDNHLSVVQYEQPQFKVNIKVENAYKGEKDVYFDDLGLGMTLIESHKQFSIV